MDDKEKSDNEKNDLISSNGVAGLEFIDIIVTDKNEVFLIGCRKTYTFVSSTQGGSATFVNNGDIFVFNLSSEGELKGKHAIPRRAKYNQDLNELALYDFKLINQGESLYIFYNDDVKNSTLTKDLKEFDRRTNKQAVIKVKVTGEDLKRSVFKEDIVVPFKMYIPSKDGVVYYYDEGRKMGFSSGSL